MIGVLGACALSGHRTVADVMTHEVATVSPEVSVEEVSRLLAEHRGDALPVVDRGGRLLGTVAEEDLRHAGRRRGRPLLGNHRQSRPTQQPQAEARTARELMTTPAVAIRGDATLPQASRHMRRHGVRRLSVTDHDGRLIGAVTRGDLLRAFLRSDEEIHEEIRQDIVVRVLWLDPAAVCLRVDQGVVHLSGEVERRTEAEVLSALAAWVEGVVAVEDRLTWRWDDLGGGRPGTPGR